jgi:hypothetical protein
VLNRIRGKRPAPTPPPATVLPIAEPTFTAQILLVAAHILDMDPTHPLDPRVLDASMDAAADAVLRPLPDIVRSQTLDSVRVALPRSVDGDTRAEYALRLRQTARSV